ncbi:MAG: hypothetical protein Solumvirus3_23 [Solumvirus sp.]|uniref:Uncharacterized protein n=1 Tax=Solumvirus sp. TaxID=2487773 RepID=A0A3G5AGH1_9VIRU|nr:MAG: hypothetical protein Solumvirus3_23 [Solumvirus sp.]
MRKKAINNSYELLISILMVSHNCVVVEDCIFYTAKVACDNIPKTKAVTSEILTFANY